MPNVIDIEVSSSGNFYTFEATHPHALLIAHQHYSDKGLLTIESLNVDNDNRRQGIGTLVLQETLTYVSEHYSPPIEIVDFSIINLFVIDMLTSLYQKKVSFYDFDPITDDRAEKISETQARQLLLARQVAYEDCGVGEYMPDNFDCGIYGLARIDEIVASTK